MFSLVNYPNPFKYSTKIDFTISRPANVNLNLLDITGRKIKTLCSFFVVGENNSIQLDGVDLPNGFYFLELDINDQRVIRKIIKSSF